jgi:hypothetical protein
MLFSELSDGPIRYGSCSVFAGVHTLAMMGTSHIENRRLLESASGRILLQDSEHEHLHTCTVCQGVLYVLLNQPPISNEMPSESDAA